MASSRGAISIVVGTVAALAIGLVAVVALVRDTEVTPDETTDAVPSYTVQTATLGRSYTAAGVMEWKPTPVLMPGIDGGTLTSTTVAPARSVAEGEVVFSIDLQPVVAIDSAVPFFRDLGDGATGADVDALLAFLERRGHLASAAAQDGVYTGRVTTAVRAWQRSLGVPRTGFVTKGALLAVADLPALVGTSVPVGSTLPADPLLSRWLPNATFEVTVGGDVRDALEEGTAATVHVDEASYPALVDRLSVEDAAEGAIASEAIVAKLVRADGAPGPICGSACTIPADRTSTVTRVDLVLLPPVEGPVVPTSAIGVDEAGGTYVVEAGASTRTAVDVRAEADGRAVVSGIEAGSKVVALVPA